MPKCFLKIGCTTAYNQQAVFGNQVDACMSAASGNLTLAAPCSQDLLKLLNH